MYIVYVLPDTAVTLKLLPTNFCVNVRVQVITLTKVTLLQESLFQVSAELLDSSVMNKPPQLAFGSRI